MEFAKRELLKYGWTEGKGLGRDESGISEALKPKLKFDTHGLGHDNSEQFTYHWWEHLYNKAASNIDIKNDTLISRGKLDISTKKITTIDVQETYGSFVKISETSCKESNENTLFGALLTDDELFKACRGRTAHKGARHGMKLNGKLARIEEQEKLFASQKQSKEFLNNDVSHSETERKNHIDTKLVCRSDQIPQSEHQNISNEVCSKMDRKKRKHKVSEINDEHSVGVKYSKLNSCAISVELGSEHVTEKKRKKNKVKGLVSGLQESCEQASHYSSSVNIIQATDFYSSANCVQPLVLKKKKKRKSDPYKSVDVITQPCEEDKQTDNQTTNNLIESNCEPHFYKKNKKRIKKEFSYKSPVSEKYN